MNDKVNKKEKTPAQRFFDEVRMYDVGADWDNVQRVFLQKDKFEDEVVEEILSVIKEIKDKDFPYGVMVKKEIYLGIEPEDPSSEAALAIYHLKFKFLRELESLNMVRNLREVTKQQVDDASRWTEKYAEISFYPSELEDCLTETLLLVRQSKSQNSSIDTHSAQVEKILNTDVKNGIGYLFFHGQKIRIGESWAGKFKLIEILCRLGVAKTIESVFNEIKIEKDKNKIDGSLESLYTRGPQKLDLIKNQIREINRAITKHARQTKLDNFNYRLTLKAERQTVWLTERVGRRG